MDRQALNVGFWDVENETERAPVRDYMCSKVSIREVEEFCRRYHYSGRGGSMLWRYGLWDGPTLLGVVSYNMPTRRACEQVFGSEHFDKVWHMGRLAMADDAPRNSESRLIGLSLKMIQIEHPEVWGVLTFAATSQGHIGYVYQATNALYTGTGGYPAYIVDGSGGLRSTNGTGMTLDEVAARGWEQIAEPPKHRYLYILGSKTQRKQRRKLLKLPILPYPKAEETSA